MTNSNIAFRAEHKKTVKKTIKEVSWRRLQCCRINAASIVTMSIYGCDCEDYRSIVVNPKLPKVSKAKLISIHLGLVENYQPKSGLWSIPHVFIEITLCAAATSACELKGCSCQRKECCIWWSKEQYSEPWYYIIIICLILCNAQ